MVWGIRNYGLSELLRRPAVRVHHWFVFLIRDHFWQLPDNKATIRGNTCKSVPVDGHIGHGGGGSKHPGKSTSASAAQIDFGLEYRHV